jgi:fucose permease
MAIAPFALGTLSDTIGFHAAFLLVPLLLAVALVILVVRPVPDAAPTRQYSSPACGEPSRSRNQIRKAVQSA